MRALPIIGLSIVGWGNPAHADSCAPAAVISGDATLARDVRRELATRNIAAPSAACPAVKVALASSSEGLIVVDLVDASGRRSSRTVAKVPEVVSLVESWARSDLTTDLMAGFLPDPGPPTIPPARPEQPAPVAKLRPRDLVTASIAGDLARDGANRDWTGGTGTICGKLGPLCLGITAHRRSSQFRRTDNAVLATVELPIGVGPVVVMPGIGLGYGRGSWAGGGGESEPGGQSTARLEARVTVSLPLAMHVCLDAIIGSDFAPAAHTGEIEEQDFTQSRGSVRIGAGLRIGVP